MAIYIVSGFMRSGTSCMMKALEAGGLEAVYQEKRNELNEKFGDNHYSINSGGFYELNAVDYHHPNFPDNYEGKLVKCLFGGMPLLRPSCSIKHIIFMRRPMTEISKSYEAAFGHKHRAAIPEMADKLDRIQDILSMRRDVNLTIIDYHKVVKYPLTVFGMLKKKGWPINPLKASFVIDPKQRRQVA